MIFRTKYEHRRNILNKINIMDHLRRHKKSNPDAGAEELCDLLNCWLEILGYQARRFKFFTKDMSSTLGQEAMLTRRLLAEIADRKEGSTMQKLLAALNNKDVIELTESDSYVTKALGEFFSYFPEYLYKLPFILCKRMFPKELESTQVEKPKYLTESVADEIKSAAQSHLSKQVTLEYRIEDLLEGLNEFFDYYCKKEKDIILNTPVYNLARKLIVSSECERNEMANKLIDIMIQDIDKLIQNISNHSKPIKLDWRRPPSYFLPGSNARLVNIMVVFTLVCEESSFSLQITTKFINAAWDIARRHPYNTILMAIVNELLNPILEVSQNKQMASEIATTIIDLLKVVEPKNRIFHGYEEYYLIILKLTLFALDSDKLNQAASLFVNYTSIENTASVAYGGLAKIAICAAPSDAKREEYQEIQNKIMNMFFQKFLQMGNFDIQSIFNYILRVLNVDQEKIFAEKLRIFPNDYVPTGILLNMIRNAVLKKIHQQQLISEHLFEDTPLPKPLCSLVASFAV